MNMLLKLIRKVKEADKTNSYFWKSKDNIKWQPGQYLYYSFDKLIEEDKRGNTRQFTISSSPTEGPEIRLTTRIRDESAFKKTLDSLKIGAQIKAEGPHGSYILDSGKTNPQVFIAGGIGITPFRCFIKYAIDKKFTTPMYLIYSNSDSNFVFGSELKEWEGKTPNFKIIFYNSTDGGHLDETKVETFLSKWSLNTKNIDAWIVGPPPFVSALEEVMDDIGIEDAKIHTEKFTGY